MPTMLPDFRRQVRSLKLSPICVSNRQIVLIGSSRTALRRSRFDGRETGMTAMSGSSFGNCIDRVSPSSCTTSYTLREPAFRQRIDFPNPQIYHDAATIVEFPAYGARLHASPRRDCRLRDRGDRPGRRDAGADSVPNA